MSDLQFTDDDLKRLKEKRNLAPVDSEIYVEKLSALLTRLEKSERCTKAFRRHGLEDEALYLDWQQSCGR